MVTLKKDSKMSILEIEIHLKKQIANFEDKTCVQIQKFSISGLLNCNSVLVETGQSFKKLASLLVLTLTSP